MSGWHRLWVLISVLYLIFVAAMTVFTFPRVENTAHTATFYNHLSPNLRNAIKEDSIPPWERYAATPMKEPNKSRWVLLQEIWWTEAEGLGEFSIDQEEYQRIEMHMPNKHTIVFKKKTPIEDIEASAKGYWEAVRDQHRKIVSRHIMWAFIFWALPVVGLYALGRSIGWVIRGFRKS